MKNQKLNAWNELNKFTKPIIVLRGESAAYKFIEGIPKEFEYCKKVMKKTL